MNKGLKRRAERQGGKEDRDVDEDEPTEAQNPNDLDPGVPQQRIAKVRRLSNNGTADLSQPNDATAASPAVRTLPGSDPIVVCSR